MKTIIISIVATLVLTSQLLASNIGDGSLAVLKSEKVEMTLDNDTQKSLILVSEFSEKNDDIHLLFSDEVMMVQIFNDKDEIEMILPIDSKDVNFGMSLFDSGEYRLGFSVSGMSEIQFTTLNIQ